MVLTPKEGVYQHIGCRRIKDINRRVTKKERHPSIPTVKKHQPFRPCCCCGQWDLAENLTSNKNTAHPECARHAAQATRIMKPFKPEVCAMTGLEFSAVIGDLNSNGDHNHETLEYRGHIVAVANRFEGAMGKLMQYTGKTAKEVFDMYEVYMSRPGRDIGLKPYPELGYATVEEAEAAFNETTN